MDNYKEEVVKLLKKHLKGVKVEDLIEVPPDPKMGDFAFPCFCLAKEFKQSPVNIAKDLQAKIKPTSLIGNIKAEGPYINFCINKGKQAESTLKEIAKKEEKYGSSTIGKGKAVVIDYSSPNIAKPFGIAHLRSTMIGNSLYRLYNFLGYKCIGINHLGDWGTQFGKLIVAYNKWGSQIELEKSPIKHLLDLYVKFHEVAEKEPILEKEARDWFNRLELGDKEAEKLWKSFSEKSMSEFSRIYKRLDIKFDEYAGESSYNKMIEPFIKQLEEINLTEESEGALVVNLGKFNIPPCILRKSDGATTYEVRDLAAADYRYKKYKFVKMLYIIDNRQNLHMEQVLKVLDLMGKEWAKDCYHIQFGVMKFPGEIMSTRKGKVVFLEDVLDKAKEKILEIIKEKNPNLVNKKEIAEMVAVGAITFWDLSHDRIRDITFEWDKVLDFEGETGPYVQYTHVRAASILNKAKEQGIMLETNVEFNLLKSPEELKIIDLLTNFDNAINSCIEHDKPSILARFTIELSQAFNEFYHSCPCLSENNKELMQARLLLIFCVKQVLANSFTLLGIKAPESM